MVRFFGAVSAVAATAVLAACRPAPTVPRLPPANTVLRTQVANAEARRQVTELEPLVASADPLARELALRGLGRVGGPRARAALITALRDPDNLRAAANGIGVLASLDELSPHATQQVTAALLAALRTARGADRIAVIEALGRAADATAQLALAPRLADRDDATRTATAYAYARFGRRKQPLDPGARAALIPLITDTNGDTAFAAIYAFARETLPSPGSAPPPAHQRASAALTTQLEHTSAAIRAAAAQALAKQNVVGAAHAQLERALLDTDWRVAVEAVRALAGPNGDDAGRDAVATAMPRRFAALERGKPTEAHVVIEALQVLMPYAKRPLVQAALVELAQAAASSTQLDQLAYGWITCLDLAALSRTTEAPDLDGIEACKLPDHLKLPLIAALITDEIGTLATRQGALGQLLAHPDARVRAAALPTLATLWPETPTAARAALLGTFVAAIGAEDPILAGAALDAAPAFYLALGTDDHTSLDAAIVARTKTELDPELSAAALELVGKRAIASGLEVCRAKLGGVPTVAAAARSCVASLGELGAPDPSESEPTVRTAPAMQLTFGPITWVLVTSRGTIEIALDPASAPWAVASIIQLTRRGFYTGLEVHRVVPDFVVQGGDPTRSGWGGPGYTLPAEPSADARFVEGGVGLADAGRDTAGSQWFIMHSAAPHLDARYTWFGHVTKGVAVANALLIGDRISSAYVIASRGE